MGTAIIIYWICIIVLWVFIWMTIRQWLQGKRLSKELRAMTYEMDALFDDGTQIFMRKIFGAVAFYKHELSESKEREKIATKIIIEKREEIDAINAKWETIEKGYKDKIKELNKQLKK